MTMPNGIPSSKKPLVEVLQGSAAVRPPLWLMRQAGRYLPEYRAVRERAGGFLDLCYRPELAAEVTLQPIRRFGFDAAILFSDILVIPHALGQRLWFEEGEGPRLEPVGDSSGIARLDPSRVADRLAPIMETVRLVQKGLPKGVALIGFCGAPWTVATYMVAGRGSSDQAPARLWAYREPASFKKLIDLLVNASIDYLAGQSEAGADVLQIFDTWAGGLPDDQFDRWVIEPTRAIVGGLRGRGVREPIIGFPRGADSRAAAYARETGVNAVGCGTSMSLESMKSLADSTVVQGNLDPVLLAAGGKALDRRVRSILAAMKGRPHVFNLGHGIRPETPPAHVARLVELVRQED